MSAPAQLVKRDWRVTTVPLTTCQRLVRQHHYAEGGSNTATYRHGLFRAGGGGCQGIAWWIPPTRSAAEASWEGDWQQVLALTRLVILPDVPKNAATFLLARSVREIKKDARFRCLVTYADEWQGHHGGIYRAAGWEYVGLTGPERVYTLNGRMVARKAGPSTRTHGEMLALGCECLGAFSKHKFRKVLPARTRRPAQQSLGV